MMHPDIQALADAFEHAGFLGHISGVAGVSYS
jgi:hypothetical protein